LHHDLSKDLVYDGEGGESGDEGEVESGVEDIGLQTKFNHKEGKSSKPQNLDLQPAIYID
jgi:hypothetical protein